jgi:hypothetical protein
MNRECVLNCDFFRDVSNECIIRLVHSFKFAVFLAHDVLADEGELASELVFVIHGSAKGKEEIIIVIEFFSFCFSFCLIFIHSFQILDSFN